MLKINNINTDVDGGKELYKEEFTAVFLQERKENCITYLSQ